MHNFNYTVKYFVVYGAYKSYPVFNISFKLFISKMTKLFLNVMFQSFQFYVFIKCLHILEKIIIFFKIYICYHLVNFIPSMKFYM